MASIEDVLDYLRRMEREQRVRDDGLRCAFHIYTDEVVRLQKMIVDIKQAAAMPMEMGEFMTLMTTMLNRQQQLLESIGERVEEDDGVDADEAWDNAFPDDDPAVHPPTGQ